MRGLDLCHGGTSATKALSALIGRVPLCLLDLKNCHVTDGAARILSPGLAYAPCLVSLNLSRTDAACRVVRSCSCGIAKSGALALCSALEGVATLQELDLSRQDLDNEGVSAVGVLIARHTLLSTVILDDVGEKWPTLCPLWPCQSQS